MRITSRTPGSVVGALVLAALLALGGIGCGEDTPEGEELTSPAEEEAVPRDAEALEKTAEERAEAQAEAAQELERMENRDLPGDPPPPEEPETAP